MPRQARVVAVGAPHHITQRGNNRQDRPTRPAEPALRLGALTLISPERELDIILPVMGDSAELSDPPFIQPATLSNWILQNEEIWQEQFMEPTEFARFSTDRGIRAGPGWFLSGKSAKRNMHTLTTALTNNILRGLDRRPPD
jgi:hypothetical protein